MEDLIPGIKYDDLHSVAKLNGEAHYKDVMKVRPLRLSRSGHESPRLQAALPRQSPSLNTEASCACPATRRPQRVRDVLDGTTKEVDIRAGHLEDDPTYK
jgi:hypothetical protein